MLVESIPSLVSLEVSGVSLQFIACSFTLTLKPRRSQWGEMEGHQNTVHMRSHTLWNWDVSDFEAPPEEAEKVFVIKAVQVS